MINRIRRPFLSLLAGALGASLSMAQGITMTAVEFTKLDGGPADFYVDAKNKALAIDATKLNFRSKWAIAEMPFPGATGTYDIVFHSMYESDGESRYALHIGGDSVGAFQNPSAYTGNKLTIPDYTLYKHTFKGVKVAKGAAVKAYGMTHSNGKVPEKGSFAWSRGRWSKLEFQPATPSSSRSQAHPGLPAPRISLSPRSVTLEGVREGRYVLRLLDLDGRLALSREIEYRGSGAVTLPLAPGALNAGIHLATLTGPSEKTVGLRAMAQLVRVHFAGF